MICGGFQLNYYFLYKVRTFALFTGYNPYASLDMFIVYNDLKIKGIIMDIAQPPCEVVFKSGENTLTYLPTSINDQQPTRNDVFNSWVNERFDVYEELGDRIGLRKPQVGALYSVLGYIKSDDRSPATIVMPTGTGKTETILSIVVAGKFNRTLVIVPSDALRQQTCDKFIKLGLLRQLNLIDDKTLNPKVLSIKQGAKSGEGFKQVEDSNVIVATVDSLTFYNDLELSKLTSMCSHLIIDEAHHVAARTWSRVKEMFTDKFVFQFTATPFRTDGKRVDGKVLYNYPISEAQKDGYFKEIEFHPIKEFVEELADEKIANMAISLLKKDIAEGFEHILMARAGTIKKAEKIYKLYQKHKELFPVLINSKSKNKKQLLLDIKSGKHKIIVCVDMLGEGFDLPQLKISALHDLHKSINVMLQFTGRFTRQDKKLGNAKFIANIADTNVNDILDELYNEDSDWNSIIRNISTTKVSNEKEYQDFRAQFNTDVSKLIDFGLSPKISTTIYRMSGAKWVPNNFTLFEDKNTEIIDSTINEEQSILIFSVKTFNQVKWSSSYEVRDISWDLYVAFYDKKLGLLFIHSSAKEGRNTKLIKLIAPKAIKLTGDRIFRVLSGIKRLSLQNVGLNQDRKDLRFMMYTGSDTQRAIPELESQRARKSNIFGLGYENGERITIGCSHKGKIWAMDTDSINVWVKWCSNIGTKIMDDTINPNEVLKTSIKSQVLSKYPDIPLIGIDWPVEILRKNEGKISLYSNNDDDSMINFEFEPFNPLIKDKKSIKVNLRNSKVCYELTLLLEKDGVHKVSCDQNVKLRIGDAEFDLENYLSEHPPILFLSDTSTIEAGYRYYTSEDSIYPYDKERIQVWAWEGVDISTESQRVNKISNSIQFHTIKNIKNDYDLIFDDDGNGEIADIVAIKNLNDDELIIDFYHLKYCGKKDGKATPGARVDDIYQVSGQAMKSVKWINNNDKLFERLLKREKLRLGKNQQSRIDLGDIDLLQKLRKVSKLSKTRYGVYIVQPAISKIKVTRDMLSVIGATQCYIKDTTGAELEVISSE